MNGTSLAVLFLLTVLALAAHGAEHRNRALKGEACARDGVPKENCAEYEADHIIPLCAGGPDELSNIQLQPWEVARRKDLVERRMCADIRHRRRTILGVWEFFLGHKGAW